MPQKYSLGRKFRNRIDRLAPGIAFKALNEVARSEMPNVVRRLFTLVDDNNSAVALAAIDKILKYCGVEAFVNLGLKITEERMSGGGEGGDPEEKQKTLRRKNLAKRYGKSPAAA